MRRALLLLGLLVVASFGQDEPRFRAIDLVVDTDGKALAAYQVELVCGDGALIVGVEGGEPDAFKQPPYYDTKALQGGRIVLAAFTTDKDAPRGRLRIARVHMQETGAVTYTIKAITAAAPGGERIPVRWTVVPLGEKR